MNSSELWEDDSWAYACDAGFSEMDAAVACRELGYVGAILDLGAPGADFCIS